MSARFWRWWYKKRHRINPIQLHALGSLLQSRREWELLPADAPLKPYGPPLEGVNIARLRVELDRAFRRLKRGGSNET